MPLAVHYLVTHGVRLESTREVRVAQVSPRLEQLLRFFRALQTYCVHHNSINARQAWANCQLSLVSDILEYKF